MIFGNILNATTINKLAFKLAKSLTNEESFRFDGVKTGIFYLISFTSEIFSFRPLPYLLSGAVTSPTISNLFISDSKILEAKKEFQKNYFHIEYNYNKTNNTSYKLVYLLIFIY